MSTGNLSRLDPKGGGGRSPELVTYFINATNHGADPTGASRRRARARRAHSMALPQVLLVIERLRFLMPDEDLVIPRTHQNRARFRSLYLSTAL